MYAGVGTMTAASGAVILSTANSKAAMTSGTSLTCSAAIAHP